VRSIPFLFSHVLSICRCEKGATKGSNERMKGQGHNSKEMEEAEAKENAKRRDYEEERQ
jgi:hypothetical protein